MAEPRSLADVALSDRYTIESEIGRGGMATVYLAHDPKHHRQVAVKVLRPELAASIGPERFLREIRIAARLTHPNIMPLFDSGEIVGPGPQPLLYYVMPYLRGQSLRQQLALRGRLPVVEAVRIAAGVASALAHAHAQGVVHRDIKPENILLEEGEPVVTDFGIARAADATAERVTAAGMVLGTLAYMSPEQLTGEELDGRSDLYSLGCVLHEMLLGAVPSSPPNARVVSARPRRETPQPVAPLRSDIPPALQQVLDRALAKRPADRYQSAGEMATALGEVTGDVRARALTTGDRQVQHRRRLLGWTTLGLVAAASIALVLIWPRTLLDPNRVVVFPLSVAGAASDDAPGQAVALLLGHALQHTDPLKWIDGWTLLDDTQRHSLTGIPGRAERDLARRAGARYYLDGAMVRAADSVTIILRLYDSQADSLIAQSGRAAPTGEASLTWPALGALTQLLPALLVSGRQLDPQVLASIAGHDPGALANWLQGDRAYREGHFRSALDLYQHALARDSTLALAALSGAQAAGWLAMQDTAVALAQLARRHAGLLPARFSDFADAFAAFGSGDADSASRSITRALAADSLWAEAWAVKGEIWYHLMPGTGNLDSVAEQAFARAAALDPGFSPPLTHLADLLLRRKDLAGAQRVIDRLRSVEADSGIVTALMLMRDCLRLGPGAVEWDRAARAIPVAVLTAARGLAAGATDLPCAERGFRAVLADTTHSLADRWGALIGLNAVLVATGRSDDVRHMVDSASPALPLAPALYLVDATAGLSLGAQDDSVAASLWTDPSTMGSALLWYLGEWSASQRDSTRLAALVTAAEARGQRSGTPGDQLLAQVLRAHATLLAGDSAAALPMLAALTSVMPLDSLVWSPWYALAVERVLLAGLLLARGQPAEAAAVARVVDGSQSLAFVALLPRAVVVRLQAAEQLGDATGAQRVRGKLQALHDSGLQPPPGGQASR